MFDPAGGVAMSDIGPVLAKLAALGERLPAGERAAVDALLADAGVAPTVPATYNPFLPGVHGCPWAHYRELRETNPVHWSPALRSWVVCRYDDVAAALRHPGLSVRTGAAVLDRHLAGDPVPTVRRLLLGLLNELDPPEHTALRRRLTRTLAAAPLAPADVEAVAHDLLDRVAGAGRMDLVGDLAEALPALVGAAALGVPAADRDEVGRLAREVVATFALGFADTPAMDRGERAAVELLDVLAGLAGGGDPDRLTVAANILLGTQENVTHAITTLVRLRLAEPDRPVPPAEVFRRAGSTPVLSRVTTGEVELGGVRIPAGQPVALLLAAADRDPDRAGAPSLAFGAGRRACPGASWARVMVPAAVRVLFARLPGIEPAGPPAWREEINVHGLARFPVTFRVDR